MKGHVLGSNNVSIIPWFPEFDATNMVVTTFSVWVRLPNLPFPFWYHHVLDGIGNNSSKFKKRDMERIEKGIFTFPRICVEIDLNKGLLDHIILKHRKSSMVSSFIL